MYLLESMLVLLGLSAGISGCEFQGLIAECGMKVGGIDLVVRANINHCSTPIDVTFVVNNAKPADAGDRVHEEGSYGASDTPVTVASTKTNSRPKIDWQYTFVTTNQAETREVPGFDPRSLGVGRVLLHLLANTTTPQKLKRSSAGTQRVVEIKAQFSVDGQTDPALAFLSDRVYITHFDDCASLQYQTEINYIALATIVVVAGLGLLSLVGLCIFKYKRRSTEDELDLMDNMQQGSPTRPYNLTTPEQRSEFHRRQPSIHLDMVHYVVPAPAPDGGQTKDNHQDKTNEERYNSTQDLKLYVSTPTGLKKVTTTTTNGDGKKANKKKKAAPPKFVKFTNEQNKVAEDSVDEEELPPPPLPRKPQIQDPMSSINGSPGKKSGSFLTEDICSSPTSSDSPSSMSDRSLGAIPKKRIQQMQPKDYSSLNSTKSGRSRRSNPTSVNHDLQLDVKCRQQHHNQSSTGGSPSSPISSSSSTSTSVSR